MEPLVSIIIPTFNRAQFLGATLDSVIAQEYRSWECIVIDDGSNDHTEELLQFYCSRDNRIRSIFRLDGKKGASTCRNIGLKRSKGKYIQFLDSDDFLGRKKLLEQVRVLETREGDVIGTSKWGYFYNTNDLNLRFKHFYNSYKNFEPGVKLLKSFGLHNEFFPPHVYLTSKNLIEKSGYWNEDLTNNDDAEFFARVLIYSSQVIFVPEATAYYRIGNEVKLSHLNEEKKVYSAIKSVKLIESHFSKSRGSKKYLQNLKNNIFMQIRKEFPQIVYHEREFFRNRRSYNFNFFSFWKRIINQF